MRVGYEEWTERARVYLREHGLVSFPDGEECAVVPSPHFQRPVLAVASYMQPPPFSDRMKGHFFVPFPPDGASEDEIQKRLASNSYPGIPTTAVHEAYPGHHWHLVMSKANPSRLRQVFRTPYFSEGWALYAERMMREQGFFTDLRHEMNQYEATIFRAARIVVDTSLHLGEMSWDEAVDFMTAQHRADGADREGRGHPLLRLAHAGELLPHRLPRDRPHPRCLLRGARLVRHRCAARIPRRDHVVRWAADRAGRAGRAGNGRSAHRSWRVSRSRSGTAVRWWKS